jgi:ATP-binding cassette, subfamily B, bacterial PglK
MNEVREIFSLLSKRDKQVLLFLMIFSFFVSFLETVGIAAIMVFVSVATNFDVIMTNKYCVLAYQWLHCSSPVQFIMWCGFGLLTFYLIRAVFCMWHLYLINYFAQMRLHFFATRFFKQYLSFSLQDFVANNSAAISQVIFGGSGNLAQAFSAMLTLLTEVLIIFSIYIMLFIAHWKMTLGLTVVLGIQAALVIFSFSKKIDHAGKRSQQGIFESTKIFNETFGNFKLIKLFANERLMMERFSQSMYAVGRANTVNVTLQNLPRFLLETGGFIMLICMILVIVYRFNDAHSVIPIVSLYALAFYRLLPSINKILASYHQLNFYRPAMRQIIDYAKTATEFVGDQAVRFTTSISLENVSFGYHKDKYVIRDACIQINKGEKVAFVGQSGSGKSTLLDIVMGMYKPLQGHVTIDGSSLSDLNIQAWRNKIGYIPQAIYLFDGTVAANVVFGRAYDDAKIIQVLRQANIYDFLCMHEGIATKVGEGGVTLSGGQKQRIAIARALYGDPEVLILDEATSALDNDNESKIMEEIYAIGGNKTLLVVAHRLSTIQRCEKAYTIENGQIKLYEQKGDLHVERSEQTTTIL